MKKVSSLAILVCFGFLFCVTNLHAEDNTTTSTTVSDTKGTNPASNEKTITTTTTTTSKHDIDPDIVTGVYDKFKNDSALIGTDITVTSKNGVVNLEGNVTMQSQADAAVQDAKLVANVKDVRSNIIVKTHPIGPSQPTTTHY